MLGKPFKFFVKLLAREDKLSGSYSFPLLFCIEKKKPCRSELISPQFNKFSCPELHTCMLEPLKCIIQYGEILNASMENFKYNNIYQ